MEEKGIKTIEKTLKNYKGEDVMISIFHKLYGNQKMKCRFDYIFDEKRVGFCANDQEIYLDRANIVNCGVEDGIYFADDVTEIKIVKM